MRRVLPGLPPLLVAIAGAWACSGGGRGGGDGAAPPPPPPSQPGSPQQLYQAASAACAGMQIRTTGKTYYFCDCQTPGSEDRCEKGSDSNYAAYHCDKDHPCQSWTQAVRAFNAMKAGDTVALCKGGFWNVPTGVDVADGNCGYSNPALSNSACAPGSDLKEPNNPSTCDLRDYQAGWGGTKRPVLNIPPTGFTNIISVNSTLAGLRILNLELRGGNPGPRGSASKNDFHVHRAIGTGMCNTAVVSNWLVCNNSFNHFMDAVETGELSTQAALDFWGNRFEMNDLDAFLGNPGTGGRIDANYFDNNGSFTNHPLSGNSAHVFYLAAKSGVDVSGVQFVNNEIRRTGAGGTPGPCAAPIMESHCTFSHLNVENNIIDGGANADGNCYGMSFENYVANNPTAYRGLTVRRNLITPGGLGIGVGDAPDAVFENNVVALTSPASAAWMQGIVVPLYPSRSSVDAVADRTIVRNNTVYIGYGSVNNTGISVGVEGTGHVIANNAVYVKSGTVCFRTELAPGAYAFVGSNACFGGTWGTALDTTTHVTADPLFTDPPTDFTLKTGSPLIGAGSAAQRPETDITLKTRPSTPSIGAYEP